MSAEDNTEDDKPKVEEDKDEQNGSVEQENDKGSSPAKATPKKETKSPAKTPAKSPAKKPVKKEEEPKEEDGEDEDDDEEEEEEDEPVDEKDRKVGLLDLPLEVSGARERKKVDRLSFTYAATPANKKTNIPEGSGERLGESPRIEQNLSKTKADDLKVLHRILFNRSGTASEIKRNIRKFNGFPFKTDTPESEKKRSNLEKLKLADLRSICRVLELERGGTKDEIVFRIVNFLVCPSVSHDPVPQSKKSKRKSRKSSDGKRKGKSKKGASDESESDDKSENGKESDRDDDDEDEEDSKTKDYDSEKDEDENSDDEEDEKPVNKRKKTPKTKAKPAPKKKKEKKEVKKVTKKEKKPAAKKAPAPKKRSRSTEDDDDDSDNSDDEPLSKKTKQPPTDDELKALVKSILEGANLEEITMKTVCKQVYAKYPEFDLSDRKEFIKSTVRSNI